VRVVCAEFACQPPASGELGCPGLTFGRTTASACDALFPFPRRGHGRWRRRGALCPHIGSCSTWSFAESSCRNARCAGLIETRVPRELSALFQSPTLGGAGASLTLSTPCFRSFGFFFLRGAFFFVVGVEAAPPVFWSLLASVSSTRGRFLFLCVPPRAVAGCCCGRPRLIAVARSHAPMAFRHRVAMAKAAMWLESAAPGDPTWLTAAFNGFGFVRGRARRASAKADGSCCPRPPRTSGIAA